MVPVGVYHLEMRIFNDAPSWRYSSDKLNIWTKIKKIINITMYTVTGAYIQLHVPPKAILYDTYEGYEVRTEPHISYVIQNVHLIGVKY
jgi:hypothetical protein